MKTFGRSALPVEWVNQYSIACVHTGSNAKRLGAIEKAQSHFHLFRFHSLQFRYRVRVDGAIVRRT